MPELRLPAACLRTSEEEDAFFAALPQVAMAYPEIYDYVIQVDDAPLGEEALRALLALFRHYQAPMAQLAVFETPANCAWFRDPEAWWHEPVFASPSTVPAVALH
jgi:hypothetical protein